ncbi:alpha/beta hydrolase [Marinococcus sp. PL1-022]|uniref:alpha/beta hydrolase n=1 Tax=Marinococcus sp. PL1-022 TaxID=3095363 RepID=UPI0029C3EDB3|nr:alpha/beta hydrolase [Marinococcus sp. PL1-022]MDX6153701.1 alpha/beta hydrolase [Marinococcus sp. PL1-022]
MNDSHEELVHRLKEKLSLVKEGSAELVSKNIPFFEKEEGLDPRVKQFLEQETDPVLRRPMSHDDLEIIRSRKEKESRDLSSNIRMETKLISLEGRDLELKVYNRSKNTKPMLVYFHGGGFFERDERVMDNTCKLLAEKAEAVVVAVEYRLAPEHKYAEGLNDCFDSVRYVCDNRDEFGADTGRVGLVGDSVGGNLALGVYHLSREKSWNICYMSLLCPLLDLSDVSGGTRKMEQYDPGRDKELVRQELVTMRESLSFIQSLYVTDLEELDQPLVSPLRSKESITYPPMTVITAEFDFLRTQGEEFMRKLQQQESPVRYIEYKGMVHTFLKKLGYYPQAADAIRETAVHFREVLQNNKQNH